MGRGFGLWSECPDPVRVAWGARAILRDGHVDLLWDRQSAEGTEEDRTTFCKRVDKVLPFVRSKVKELCCSWDGIRPDVAKLFVLYEDDGIVVKANTNASYGYLYIIAYAKDGDAAWDSVCNAPAPEVPKPETAAQRKKREKAALVAYRAKLKRVVNQ